MEDKKVRQFVVGVLVKDGECLAEVRRASEHHLAGMTVFPGGGIEEGETTEVAIVREMKEELGVEVKEYKHLADYTYDDGCPVSIFVITKWEGEPKAYEAENIVWVKNENELANEFNKKIFKKVMEKNK